MAAHSNRSFIEIQGYYAKVQSERDLEQQLRFYSDWATDYDQDVVTFQYQAPRLAVASLASVFQGPREDALVLDVACGTGLVAQELQGKGFRHIHGLDGSQGMLERARQKGLYEDLKLCLLGQDPLPAQEGSYDATLLVGALCEGHVPIGIIPQLLLATKPGGYICLTTRGDQSNLRYKTELQELLKALVQQEACEEVMVQEVEKWQQAATEQESGQAPAYIPGGVYIYQKKAPETVV